MILNQKSIESRIELVNQLFKSFLLFKLERQQHKYWNKTLVNLSVIVLKYNSPQPPCNLKSNHSPRITMEGKTRLKFSGQAELNFLKKYQTNPVLR